MASAEPLDELIWRNQEWVNHFGGIHENTVLYYFAKSPFFDPTSNNASVETQAMYNPDMVSVLETRDAFEAHLDGLNGLEYRVHLGPRDFGGEKPIGQGLWVIRKQNRRINYDSGRGPTSDVAVLASYFVIGESIYMAPSLYDVFSSRLLSTTVSLNKIVQKIESLAIFSPSIGPHYIPVNFKARATVAASQNGEQSKEPTPAPETAETTAPKDNSVKSTGLRTLLDAYAQFNMYGNEYMDENPLQGEPGSFVFSSSREHVRAQQEAAARRAQQQIDLKKAQEESRKAAAEAQAREKEAQQAKLDAVGSKRALKDARGGPKAKKRKSRMHSQAATPAAVSD